MKKVILIILFIISLFSSSISAYCLFSKGTEVSDVSSEGMASNIKEEVSEEGFFEKIISKIWKKEESDVLFEEVINQIDEKAVGFNEARDLIGNLDLDKYLKKEGYVKLSTLELCSECKKKVSNAE